MNIVAWRGGIGWVLYGFNTLFGFLAAVLHSAATLITLVIHEFHTVLVNIYMHGLILIVPLPGSYTVFNTLYKTTGDLLYAIIIALVVELSLGGLAYLIITALVTLRNTAHWWAFKVLVALGILVVTIIFWFVIQTDIEYGINPLKSILLLCLPVVLLPAVAISNLLRLHKKAIDFDTAFPDVNVNDSKEVVTYSDSYIAILIALLNGPLSKSEIAKGANLDVLKVLNKAGRGPLADAMNNGHVERVGSGVKTKYQLLDTGKLIALQE